MKNLIVLNLSVLLFSIQRTYSQTSLTNYSREPLLPKGPDDLCGGFVGYVSTGLGANQRAQVFNKKEN